MSNSFETFAKLPVKLQREALREGELRLQAQLQSATAADQRALTWAGFVIGGATAALGGGIALLTKKPSDPILAYLAIIFAGALLRAAWLAVGTVAPSLFCFPGNRPGLWLPDQWESGGTEPVASQQARMDQARQLDQSIRTNAGEAAERAADMRKSFKLTFWAVGIAGVLLLITVTARQVTIREPTSEIIFRSATSALISDHCLRANTPQLSA